MLLLLVAKAQMLLYILPLYVTHITVRMDFSTNFGFLSVRSSKQCQFAYISPTTKDKGDLGQRSTSKTQILLYM
jgi:hypothetical protein